jgi:hypothetical protein
MNKRIKKKKIKNYNEWYSIHKMSFNSEKERKEWVRSITNA